MKRILIFPMLFLSATGAFSQIDSNGHNNFVPVPNVKLKLSSTDIKQIPNLVLIENLGSNNQADSLGTKILPGEVIRAQEIVYQMPIKDLESDSRMPVHVPNPEINYTILDKRVGGVVIDPRKD